MKILIDFIIAAVTRLLGNRKIDDKKEPIDIVLSTESDVGKGCKVVIDPGHGGKNGKPDPGAVGLYNGEPLYERDTVLQIAGELAIKLDLNGFDVIMTRVDNTTLSHLKDKVDIVKEEKPDIFISIHANANSGTPAQGIETFYNKNKPQSKELASCIQQSLVSTFTDHKDRGIKNGSLFYVLKKHDIERCCLVECEFINHPEQAKFLVESKKEIAKAIFDGMVAYLGKN